MLKEKFDSFLQYGRIEKGFSNRTILGYQSTLKLFLNFLQKTDFKVKQITTEFIRNFLYYGKDERNWSDKTYHIYYDHLHVFCQWLKENDYLDQNPVTKISKPKLKRKIIKPLKDEEVQKILYVALLKSSNTYFLRVRNHSIVMLAFHSGLRMSEIINLRLSDLNLDEKLIHVRQGKGGKDREVVMTDDLVSHLKTYLQEHERFFQGKTLILFPSKSGKLFVKREFSRLIALLKEKTGIQFASHDFRRTYATNLSKRGISPYMMQQQLGHTDIKTTMRYVCHSREDIQKQFLKLNLY